MSAPLALVYNGVTIRDRNEMLNVTDAWRASGSPAHMEPWNWARKEGASFIEAVAVAHNLPLEQVMTKKRGKSGATWLHWQAGIAYAKYLSHDFHMWANEAVREKMEGRSVAAVDPQALAPLVHALVERALLEGGAGVTREFVFVLDVLREKGGPPKGRRAFSQLVCRKLIRFSVDRGYPLRSSRETGRYMFHIDAVNAWLKHEGAGLIAKHIADVKGQGNLFSIVPKKDDPE